MNQKRTTHTWSLVLTGVLICALILSGLQWTPGAAAQTLVQEEPDIRIGVIPATEALTVGSSGPYQIVDMETGDVLVEGENSETTVELSSTASIETSYMLQVAYTTSKAYVDDWLDRAELAGHPTYVEPYLDGWRLLIGQFPTDASWGDRVAFRDEIIAQGLGGSDSFWRTMTISEGESQIELKLGETAVSTTHPLRVTAHSEKVTMNGQRYRGEVEVAFNSSGTLVGINELPIEEYLYGVVPRELPPVPYGEIEALKAQAIAARTYALSNLGKRSQDGYDLLPTPSDQVYGGYESEHPLSTQAVQESRGVVATYDGQLITTVYSSTSGGYTANNEDVWSTGEVPYLRGVPDAERGQAIDNVPSLDVFKNHANPTSLRAEKDGDYESDWSRYHRWTYEWTMDEITEVLSDYYNQDVGEVYDINVTDRSNSGRVLEIEFVTENGTFYEQKDRVRWALKYVNSSGTHSVLRSTLFYIEPVIDRPSKETVGFVTYGGGWGHGVGMAQTGAVGMAEKGYTVEEILKHYYRGIDIEQWYE
ncbi:SpoIID/LytB domain-containing protein [Caldalkalibacillus salinus]|uniref:SpoIID/LytB domain-containing protein n=1 Tax=Caldalkalibacillus salinus TaxID=2803787 RepID=UPI001923B510|nr:SpoIID/LytB domain-containing protein [Caldalkalibacillus salinus]